jgi:quercetin dioxygenase-like cupin family protein
MPLINIEKVPVVRDGWRNSRVLASPEVLGSHHLFVSLNEIFQGAAHKSHTHSVDEMLIVLEGDGEYEEESVKQRIGPTSVVFIPKGKVHSTQNLGATPLKLIVIKALPE